MNLHGTGQPKRRFRLLWLMLPLALLAPARAATCVDAACHGPLLKSATVHAPAGEGQCDACHEAGAADHPGKKGPEFKLTSASVSEICGGCHELPADTGGLHPPVAGGECTACHDPHGSAQPHLLKGKSEAEACSQCHDESTKKMPFVHAPVEAGECLTCHAGHLRSANGTTKEKGPALCYSCHQDLKESIGALAHKHGALGKSCTACHDPHQAPREHLVRDSLPDLCYTCHTKTKEAIESYRIGHGALTEGKRCLNCHAPHGSAYAGDLVKNSMDLCLICHDRPVRVGDTPMANMKMVLEKNKQWHGPLQERDCSACHNGHGSANFRLLEESYPPGFYSPFDPAQYALCWKCHDVDAFRRDSTTETGFRDGRRNLHALHIGGTKGRTCRACHDAHASSNAFHLRETVPFGGWDLPVGFVKSKDGGGCSPGCHDQKTYRR